MNQYTRSVFRGAYIIGLFAYLVWPNGSLAGPNSDRYTQIGAGAAFADIGGGTEAEPTIAFDMFRRVGRSSALVTFGAEIRKTSGTGKAVHVDISNGEVLYDGIASVELYSLRLKLGLGYEFGGGQLRFVPYSGISPVLVLRQSIEPAGTAVTGAFDGYHGYKGANFELFGGIAVSFAWVVVDAQVSIGMFDDGESEARHGSSLRSSDQMVSTYRLGVGLKL